MQWISFKGSSDSSVHSSPVGGSWQEGSPLEQRGLLWLSLWSQELEAGQEEKINKGPCNASQALVLEEEKSAVYTVQ